MKALDHACSLLEGRHGLARHSIVRVGAAAKGGLSLEIDPVAGSGRRWFSFDGDALEELLPAQDKALPLAQVLNGDAQDWSLLAWRPGRRLALRRDDATGPRLVKGYRPRRFAQAREALELVGAALQGGDGFCVPRLLRVNPETGAYEASWLPGAAPAVLAAGGESFARIGSCLLDLQQRVETAGLPEHDALAELALLEEAARRAEGVLGWLPEGWRGALARAGRAYPRRESLVAAHRDLHDGQLLIDDDRVGLLDLDGLAAASPVLDAANLSAHLELRGLQRLDGADPHAAETCGRALLENLGGLDHDHLRFYQATTFLRLSLLYSLRPRWAHLAPSLLRYAGRCLDELALA